MMRAAAEPRAHRCRLGKIAIAPIAAHPRRMLCNSEDACGGETPFDVFCEAQAIESQSVSQRPGAPTIAHHRKTLASRLASGTLRQIKLYPLMAAAIPQRPSRAAGTLTRMKPFLQ